MEKRNNYFVTLKNGWVWIAAVCMLASMVARFGLFLGNSSVDSSVFWFQVALPLASGLYFLYVILLDGKNHLYRTALSAWGFAIGFGHMAWMLVESRRLLLLLWVVYFAICAFYTMAVGGKFRHFWLLWFVTAAMTAFFVYDSRLVLRNGGTMEQMFLFGKNALMTAAFFALSMAIQIYPDGSGYHPTWGDRSDGRLLRTLPAMTNIIPYIMPTRTGASNNLRERVDIGEMERYIRQKRREGLTNFGITHVFLTAYLRMVARYPATNRFCSGQKVYARDRDVVFSMVVKTEMTTEAPDTVIKLHLDPADTVEQVYEKLSAAVEKAREGALDSNTDVATKILTLIPGVLLRVVVDILKFLDYFGLLPGFLTDLSPFHGSVFFTSMGSLGIPPIVHHLYDFGNLPVFIAFGCKQKEREIGLDGAVRIHRYVDFTGNTDERIADGFYLATALKCMKRYLERPEKLEDPVEVKSDVE